MYFSITDIQFWAYGLLTLVAFFVSCFIPGWLALKEAPFPSKLTKAVVASALGIVLWGAQGYIFGYINIRWATWVYLVSCTLLTLIFRKKFRNFLSDSLTELRALPKSVLFTLPLFVFAQVFAHIGSGLLGPKGFGINFVNAADGMMHLAYIQSLVTSVPPLEPGQAGIAITSYHYWSDLVFAEFARVWHIPIIHLFFHYLPIILITVTSLGVIQLIKALKGGIVAQLLALFLITFGSDAAFLFSLYFNNTWGNAIAALDTGVSFIFNMPQVFSRFIFLGSLLTLIEWFSLKKHHFLIPVVIMASSLFVFKVYYGLFFITGFGSYAVFEWCKTVITSIKKSRSFIPAVASAFKTTLQLIFATIGIALLVAIFFLPNNQHTGGLVFIPLTWPRSFLSADNFNYQDWFLRMQVYEEAHNYRNIIIYNTIAVLITLFSVYGVRLLGLFPSKKAREQISYELLVFILPASVVFVIIGLSFYQQVGGLNIYNFLITPILLLNVILAISIANIKDWFYKSVVILAIVLLCTPRTYLQLKHYYDRYYSQRPDQVISVEELELLASARNLPSGTMQADSWNEYNQLTPYVSFFSGKPSYFAGERLLRTKNETTASRKELAVSLFDASSPQDMALLMKKANIEYLYITNQSAVLRLEQMLDEDNNLRVVSKNEAGIIVALK